VGYYIKDQQFEDDRQPLIYHAGQHIPGEHDQGHQETHAEKSG
jgi:hypothetical protein